MGNNNNNGPQNDNDANPQVGNQLAHQSSFSAYETEKNDTDRYLIDKIKEATHTGNWEPFKDLLKDDQKFKALKININSTNTMGDNIFLIICKIDEIENKERFEILEKLIELGANITHIGEGKQNCVHIAANQKQSSLLHFLFKFILKLPIEDQRKLIQQKNAGSLAFHYFCKQDNIETKERFEILEKLINLGASLNHIDENGQNCLHIAANQKESDLLHFLFKIILSLKSKLDLTENQHFKLQLELIEQKDNLSNLPLHYAAQWKHRKCVGPLSNYGYLNHEINQSGQTPFKMATSKRFKLALVFQNASIDKFNDNSLPKEEAIFIQEQIKKAEEKRQSKEPEQFKPRYGREKSRSFNVNITSEATKEDRGLRKTQSILTRSASTREDPEQNERASYNKTFAPANASSSSTSNIPPSEALPQTVGSLGTNPQLNQNLKH